MRIELNITMRCNAAYPNCDRGCDRYPHRTDDMSPDAVRQLRRDIQASGAVVHRVMVVGGEPVLHPQYREIVELLNAMVADGLVRKAFVGTSGVGMSLDNPPSPLIRYCVNGARKKQHLPCLWSPTDLGLPTTPCNHPSLCGFSRDNIGWLPCSQSIMIVRSFGLEHLYRDTLPTEPWGLDELCKHCIQAAPASFRQLHNKRLADITAEERTPTASWRRALERYDNEYICEFVA